MGRINNAQNKDIIPNTTTTVLRKCVVKLRRCKDPTTTTIESVTKFVEPKKDNAGKDENAIITLKNSNKKSTRGKKLLQSELEKPQRELRRRNEATMVSAIDNKIKKNSKPPNKRTTRKKGQQTETVQAEKPQTPSVRKCKVRIARTPLRTRTTKAKISEEFSPNKTEISKDKELNTTPQAKWRKCRVKLLRTPMRNVFSSAHINKKHSNIDVNNEANPQQPEESRNERSFENLANKSDMIEQILLSAEEDDEKDTTTAKANTQLASLQTPPKTHKFFHREVKMDKTITNNVACNQKEVINSPTKGKSRRKINKLPLRRRKATPKRKTSTGNIYEFLSQSQTSDSDGVSKKQNDPAADIIQKLIAEGKVAVSTKRGGKLIIKRQRGGGGGAVKKRAQKQTKAQANKKTKTEQKRVAIIDAPPPNAALEEEQENYNECAFDDHDFVDLNQDENMNELMNAVEQPAATNTKTYNEHKTLNSSPEGTFSRLARSVIIQEAGKNVNAERSRNDFDIKRRLLEVARKFVSTPVNKKNTSPPQSAPELSPIALPFAAQKPQEAGGNASPWRVNEESHLPSVFYFSRNSSNMPSISSDFIPATQADEISVLSNHTPFKNAATSSTATKLPITDKQQEKELSLSSFSSNDSNAENNPPPPRQLNENNAGNNENDQNADIFNLRQMPNPRRTLKNRSPLKAINILEVVTLPPWKHVHNQNKSVNTAAEKSANAENIYENEDENDNDNSKDSTESPEKALDLFGFEDLIDDVDDVDDQISHEENNEKTRNASRHSQRRSLHQKLKKLKRWRPAATDDILAAAAATSKAHKPAELIFDENAGKSRQRTIKEMLCSTMIQPQRQTESIASADVTAENDSDDSDENIDREEGQIDLFNDPELTLDEKEPHRTYERNTRVMRRRKPRHDFILMHIDSDEEEEREHHHIHNKSCEHDSEHEPDEYENEHNAVPKHTKKKRNKKNNVELNSFVNEFNEMCKEVEQYELIVE